MALFLSVLLGLQPVLTDLFIPGMPAIRQEFSAPGILIQATMFGAMISFGLGQLVWGALSDRVGRRPVLLWGLMLFVVSGLIGALADRMEVLLLSRVIQGAALGASVVCARAMVRDLYETRHGAQVLARGLSGLGVIAIISPLLGGVLADIWGWRANIVAIAAAGVLGWVMVWRAVPETIVAKDVRATHWRGLKANYTEILTHRGFLAWSLVALSSYGGLFVVLSGGPFIFLKFLEVSATGFGIAIAMGSLSYLLGTLVCRRLIPRRGLLGTVQLGCIVSLATAFWAIVVGMFEIRSVAAVLAIQMLFGFAHGFHQPCSNAAAPGLFPEKAGTASSWVGLLMALAGVLTGLYLSVMLDFGVRAYAWAIAFWCMLLMFAGLWVVPRFLASEHRH
ncbi:MAG: multidrug effflux MFS transporter [Burkholderiaceae bacterium]|nr:multidrug effflux MFS transporter [Burkholderiaceae bacterium]